MNTKEIREKLVKDAEWNIRYYSEKLAEAKATLELLKATEPKTK